MEEADVRSYVSWLIGSAKLDGARNCMRNFPHTVVAELNELSSNTPYHL